MISLRFTQWHTAMRFIAELDCLLALANYSLNASNVTCRPEFVELADNAQQPFLEIVDGLHPCLINTFSGNDLIPNSVFLGSSNPVSGTHHPLTLLVTGPNMGGKSTLMRQTALLVILAHLGCRLPASSCRLTSVDRIFSRLGATDRLLAGESTFMVELSETAAILSHISPHSLVLMDELGRGTSTHDGAALASAVLHYLSTPTCQSDRVCGPRTLFSTHYHSLVDEVTAENRSSIAHIYLGHMACMVEEQSEAEPGLENITFLYKFVSGACPKSYGFNAARLAHLPDEVIQIGLAKAKEYERTMTTFECFRQAVERHNDSYRCEGVAIKT
ncbi:DNA mismatch repair protein MSH6 [Paragonimus westermani]|uniref:DNA mismatch repair protein MSH6 n=1 Tax=Paragonimus westermani TaxID=34504 RepID=A0A5J4NVI7_9TREM|nr:DNA mismatch repair protein MSH6 [Paragonimus westermani]